MSDIDDGGPAYPQECEIDPRFARTFSGLSLRDWFAGQALIGICQNLDGEGFAVFAAKIAYGVADAMLAMRKKGGS